MATTLADPTDFLRSSSSDIKDDDEIIIPSKDKKEEVIPPEDKKKKEDVKPKGKEEQVSELRKQRDELQAKLTELEKKGSEIEPIKSKYEKVKSIADYIEKKEGKLDEESVNNFIKRQKDRKATLAEKEAALLEKEGRLKEISILESDEWKEKYEKPIYQAKDSFIAVIANVDKDGGIKHPELINKLSTSLTQLDKEGKPLTSVQMKSVLKQFAEEYEKKTGEDYEVPRLNEVVDHANAFINRFKASIDAKSKWDQVSQENKKKKVLEQAQQEQEAIESEIKARDYIVNKYIKNLDFSKLEGVVEKEEYLDEIKAQHSYIVESTKDASKRTREYDKFIELSAKGSLFDKLADKLRETQTLLEKEQKKNKSSLPNGGLPRKSEKKDEENVELGENEDPADYLKK